MPEISETQQRAHTIAISEAATAMRRARSELETRQGHLADVVLGLVSEVRGDEAVQKIRSRGVSRAETAKIEKIGNLARTAIDTQDYGPVLKAVDGLMPKPRDKKPAAKKPAAKKK